MRLNHFTKWPRGHLVKWLRRTRLLKSGPFKVLFVQCAHTAMILATCEVMLLVGTLQPPPPPPSSCQLVGLLAWPKPIHRRRLGGPGPPLSHWQCGCVCVCVCSLRGLAWTTTGQNPCDFQLGPGCYGGSGHLASSRTDVPLGRCPTHTPLGPCWSFSVFFPKY